MSAAGACALVAWVIALVLVLRVRALAGRLRGVGDAEHELRGPLTAIALAAASARRSPAGRRLAESLESELARARAGLADLTAARSGRRASAPPERVALESLVRSAAGAWDRRRPVRVDWRAGPAELHADRGAIAQALGNVLSNAVEHGSGPVELRARRTASSVRLEVTNPAGPSGRPERDRGRGLRIARRSAAKVGGTLELTSGSGRATAALVLPADA